MNYSVNEEMEVGINREFDYSNSIPTAQNIAYIVQYCENVYNQFKKNIEEDEQKNERLKYEYKNYNFKRAFTEKFEVQIKQKETYKTIDCKNYSSFVECINNGLLKSVDSLKIELYLDYKKGKEGSLQEHNNQFEISFKPYDIKFTRNSNFQEENMNQIENNINTMLTKFQAANTIFCTK